jgi:uncharacterized membrane protein
MELANADAETRTDASGVLEKAMAFPATASPDGLGFLEARAASAAGHPRTGVSETQRCSVCRKVHSTGDLIPAAAVPPAVSRLIRRDHPTWADGGWICVPDLNRFRLEHVKLDLGEGCGIISDLESDVLQSLTADQVLAEDLNRQYERRISRSGRMAQALTTAAGSWSFLTSFSLIVAAWIAIGSVVLPGRVPDLYPFIVVNTVLSGICALQAPVVLMGMRQREERQRLQAEIDYKRSLKAEVLSRQLSEKLDHLLTLEARHAAALGLEPWMPLAADDRGSEATAAGAKQGVGMATA